MMKIFSLVLLSVLFLQMSANAQDEGKKNNAKWLTYQDEVYTIQYPDDWELDQSGTMGTKFIIFGPQTSENDEFKENVNLMEQDLSAYNLNLDDYVALSENQVATALTNGKLLLSERVKTKKGEYHKMLYTGEMGKLHLEFEQYFRVIGDTAIILTFTSTIDAFPTFREVGEKIINSFKMK